MQKIAVVIPKYGLIGGAEQFASELTNRLHSQTEYDFHIYANRWQKSAVGVNFHQVPVISFPKFLTTVSFAYFCRHLIKGNKFSLIHSHERIFTADIFTLHGIPHRHWIHHIRRKQMSLYDLATAWVEKKLVYSGGCQKFIAVSNLTRDIFLQEYRIDPDKIAVIHPGVDLNDYNRYDKDHVRQSIRKELGIGIAEPLILFVSMNYEIKGLDAILLSLTKLRAQKRMFKLIVAGKGNIKKYKKLADQAQIGSDIIFTGPVPKEKLIQMYLAGDLYIMLSKFDTFGMVVLEALAAGLPAVISGNVGAKDLIQEGINGFIISDPSDSNYIAAKIAVILDANTRKYMAAAARETGAQNTWDLAAAKYQEIYAGILATRKCHQTRVHGY